MDVGLQAKAHQSARKVRLPRIREAHLGSRARATVCNLFCMRLALGSAPDTSAGGSGSDTDCQPSGRPTPGSGRRWLGIARPAAELTQVRGPGGPVHDTEQTAKRRRSRFARLWCLGCLACQLPLNREQQIEGRGQTTVQVDGGQTGAGQHPGQRDLPGDWWDRPARAVHGRTGHAPEPRQVHGDDPAGRERVEVVGRVPWVIGKYRTRRRLPAAPGRWQFRRHHAAGSGASAASRTKAARSASRRAGSSPRR